MPDPRPLGNVARTVLSTVTEMMDANQNEYFEVVSNVHSGDVPATIQALKDIAARNNLALRAITFLLAGKLKQAEEVLITAKLRQKKTERGIDARS
jgi:hypothetical protein